MNVLQIWDGGKLVGLLIALVLVGLALAPRHVFFPLAGALLAAAGTYVATHSPALAAACFATFAACLALGAWFWRRRRREVRVERRIVAAEVRRRLTHPPAHRPAPFTPTKDSV